jgi:flagellar secretion chaperone FliS
MYDSTSAYRTTQVASSRPIDQVVLLYQGAIRFATIHLGALDRRDMEAAHNASIRSQAIVAGLREVLDLSAGPVAGQLDALYDFILRRLMAGNTAKDAHPTIDAISLLRGLLEAWQTLAAQPIGPNATGAMAAAAAHANPAASSAFDPASTAARFGVNGLVGNLA